MIDIEADVFQQVASSLRTDYPGIFVTGEYVKTPPHFPCVSLVETDNYANTATLDSGDDENHAKVLYELNIYSNKSVGKKSECKDIANTVADVLHRLGFTRIMLNPIPNLEDNTIYRITGRFTATVSNTDVIYRR